MPFKIKLKKSRHYNVTSKSLFVISVHHLLVLDTPTTVDCTLSSESTGQECLENVCRRLSINQSEFFGLRYVVKGSDDELRWVDLERPLSRQLEKYAASPKLYLRVMYYVISGVTLITDEVTRNYYFLQLKSDVVEGRISCDTKQAVALAIYCRQAQYDSHQSERHTVDYLKTLLPFPRHLIEAGLLETLTEEVLQPNPEIQNMTQASAEGMFIAMCQQLDGYGQERFIAKEESGSEVTLGVTVAGIIVVESHGSTRFYPWHDIRNVVNHKRLFNIECTVPEKSVDFILRDAETGRYFWKLCVLQHTFFMGHEKNQVQPMAEHNVNLFQNVPEDLNESRDNLFIEQSHMYPSDSHISSTSALWPPQQQHPAESIVSSNMSLAASQQQLRSAVEQSWAAAPSDYTNRNSSWALIGSNTSLNNRAQSSSCLDLSNNNVQHERERLKAFLPGYRAAPDYETAMQQKYRSTDSDIMHIKPVGLMSDPHINIYSGSQPDVNRATAVTDAIFGQQLQQKYPDVTQTTNPMYRQHCNPNLMGGIENLAHQFQMVGIYKPPPPYQASRLSSTSTPDLASHRALLGYRGAYVSGSSPDLVSTRTFLNSHMMHQPMYPPASSSQTFRYRYSQSFMPHGTYENLNFLDAQTKSNMLSQKLQQNAYHANQQVQQQSNGMLKNSHHNGSIEPIYENIPLPWQNETTNAEMRDRASSIQSAPGVMRFKTLHQQQQQQQQQPTMNDMANFKISNKSIVSITDNLNNNSAVNHNFTGPEHRMLSKTSSNPIPLHTHPVHKHPHDMTDNGHHAVIAINQTQIIEPPEQFQQHKTTIEIGPNNNIVHDSSSAMNRSHPNAIFDTSQSSTYTNQTTTTTDSSISNGSKEKKKRRWGFFGGSKGSNSEKQKSATLGREKDKVNKGNTLNREDDNNFKHRWSTGLPRLQPLAATISKEKLSQILGEKLSDPQLYIEFERIPKRKESARYDCALNEDNRSKNFDPNFLPYDDNRVRITPTRENRLGYVNASHITATVGTKQRFYIVAQSPLNTLTLNIFWQCVWEADVYLIVQLSNELNYIPATSDKCLDYGQYQVWQEFSQNTGRCITSKLRVYHAQSRRYRSVWHLHYSNWAEQNCPPDVEHFLDFLKELSSVRMASVNEVPPGHNTNPPVLIHCSEGGGRAGVTLASDLLLYTLDHNQDLDIPRVVGQLRHQRDNIIPSLAQYKFIYALIIHSLNHTRLI